MKHRGRINPRVGTVYRRRNLSFFFFEDFFILFHVYECSAGVDIDGPYVCLVPAEVRVLDLEL